VRGEDVCNLHPGGFQHLGSWQYLAHYHGTVRWPIDDHVDSGRVPLDAYTVEQVSNAGIPKNCACHLGSTGGRGDGTVFNPWFAVLLCERKGWLKSRCDTGSFLGVGGGSAATYFGGRALSSCYGAL